MPRKVALMVAPKAAKCRICQELTPQQVAEVNAAIWSVPGVDLRPRGHRPAAQRACAVNGLVIDIKTVDRHADHIAASWHEAKPQSPVAPGERPVFPTDFTTVTERYANLGMAAVDQLEGLIPTMDPKELVPVARMGLGAVQTREAMRLRAQEVQTAEGMLAALFGVAGGHLSEGDIPDVEVIDVTPVEDLHAEVEAERAALEALQAGEPVGAG